MRKSDRHTPDGLPADPKEAFKACWYAVPQNHIANPLEALANANKILGNPKEDWNRRCDQLKLIRVVVLQEPNLDANHLQKLTDSLEISLKDLRSQIVKEAALTISFLISRFPMSTTRLAEQCLPAAFSQVAVSAKVVSENAALASEFMVQFTESRQIFIIVGDFATSKDKSQRKHSAFLLGVILEHWNQKLTLSLMPVLTTGLQILISDADSNTRVAGRKTFNILERKYNKEAGLLFVEFDVKTQRLLVQPNGGSSNLSLNGKERLSVPFSSALSKPTFSAGFLAKRSVSASGPMTVTTDMTPGGTKFTRPVLSHITPPSAPDMNSDGTKLARPAVSNQHNHQKIPTVLNELQQLQNQLKQQKQDHALLKMMHQAVTAAPAHSKNYDDEFYLLPPKRVEEELGISPKVVKNRRSVPLILSSSSPGVAQMQINTPSPRSRAAEPRTAQSLLPVMRNHESPRIRLELNTPPNRGSPRFNEFQDRSEFTTYLGMIKSTDHVKTCDGLVALQKFIASGKSAGWTDETTEFFPLLFVALTGKNEIVRTRALRVIMKICTSRAQAIFNIGGTMLRAVLDATGIADGCENNALCIDTLKMLGTHLRTNTVVKFVGESMGSASEKEQIIMMIMVKEVFERLEEFELRDALQKLAPICVELYQSTANQVLRKAIIGTLLGMQQTMGEEQVELFIADKPQIQIMLTKYGGRKKQYDCQC